MGLGGDEGEGARGAGGQGRGGKAEVNLFMFGPGWQAGRSEGTYLASYYKSTRSVKG